MSCARIEPLLPLFAGGDLDAAETAEVRRHLEGCPGCRQSADDLRATGEWLRRCPGPALGAEAYAGLREAVHARLRGARPRPWLLARLERAWAAHRQPGRAPTLGLAAMALSALVALALERDFVRGPAVVGSPASFAAADRPSAPAPPEDGERLLALAEPAAPADGVELDGEAGPAGQMRIELQTSDPDVRIIWFSPHAEPASDN